MRSLRLRSLLVGCSLASGLAAHAQQQRGGFRPVLEKPLAHGSVGGTGVVSIGLGYSTIFPLGTPYALSSNQPSRYQMPGGFHVEATWGLSRNLEVGASIGIEAYGTKVDTGTPTTPEFYTVSTRSYPVKLLGRYRFNGNKASDMTFELEGGLGYSFGSIDVGSTDLSVTHTTASLNAVVAHAAFGLGLPWNDNFSLHTQVGLGGELLGSKDYTVGTKTMQQASLMGVFAKMLIRYQF